MAITKQERKALREYQRESDKDPSYCLFHESADKKAERYRIEDKIRAEEDTAYELKEKFKQLLNRLESAIQLEGPKRVIKATARLQEVAAYLYGEETPLREEQAMPYLGNEDDPELPSRKFLVQSFEKMKKKEWLKNGKPSWWVRLGQGKVFRFLKIEDVPGWKPLKVVIDMEAHAIPRGETLHLGVGPHDVGVRDEYYFTSDPHDLRWYLKPIYRSPEDDPFRTESWTWWTRNYVYAIKRRIPAGEHYNPDYVCSFNGTLVNSSKWGTYIPTLEDAMTAVRRHWKKRGLREEMVQTNDDEMFIGAALEGLESLPAPPEKKPLKKEKKPKKKKRSVVKAIVRLLKAATKKNPITKEEIWVELLDKFPDKDPDALMSTVGARLGDLKKRRGVNVRKNKKGGYWVGS